MESSRRNPIWFFLATVRAAISQFQDKGGFVLSSHIAMSLMLALFPFLIFVVSLAGALSRDVASEDLIHLMFDAWPKEVADPLINEVRTVLAGNAGGLITFGGVLALYFSSNGVDAVREAMTRAYHGETRRPFWVDRLKCVIFVIVFSSLVVFVLTIGVAIPFVAGVLGDALPDALAAWVDSESLSLLIAAIVTLLAVIACHTWLPDKRMTLSQVWPGILLTFLFWGVMGQAFSAYLSYFATYSSTYAGLAGAMATLIFLNLTASILIFGAEFNAVLIDRAAGRDAL